LVITWVGKRQMISTNFKLLTVAVVKTKTCVTSELWVGTKKLCPNAIQFPRRGSTTLKEKEKNPDSAPPNKRRSFDATG